MPMIAVIISPPGSLPGRMALAMMRQETENDERDNAHGRPFHRGDRCCRGLLSPAARSLKHRIAGEHVLHAGRSPSWTSGIRSSMFHLKTRKT